MCENIGDDAGYGVSRGERREVPVWTRQQKWSSFGVLFVRLSSSCFAPRSFAFEPCALFSTYSPPLTPAPDPLFRHLLSSNPVPAVAHYRHVTIYMHTSLHVRECLPTFSHISLYNIDYFQRISSLTLPLELEMQCQVIAPFCMLFFVASSFFHWD